MKALKTYITQESNNSSEVIRAEKQHKGAENCFEVHFSGAPGSPRLLSAASKVTIAYVANTLLHGRL